MSKCQIKEPPFYQCCCTCVFHKKDFSHPSTDGKSILVQRGWICEPPMGEDIRFSGWDNHSVGCEMHTTKEQHDKWEKPYRNYRRRRGLVEDVFMYFGLIFKRLFELDKKNLVWSIKKTLHYSKKAIKNW